MNDSILAWGPPPLTVYAADCSIDVIDFVAAVVRGIDLIDVTPIVREAWRYHLASHFDMITPAERAWFVNAPAMLEIRSRWPHLSIQEQTTIRQMWIPVLPNLLRWIEPALQAGQPAPAYGQPHHEAGQSPYGTHNTMSSLLNEIHRRQRESVQTAATRDPYEAAQLEAQHQAANAQMLSNLSQLRFKTMMNTIGNMKA